MVPTAQLEGEGREQVVPYKGRIVPAIFDNVGRFRMGNQIQ